MALISASTFDPLARYVNVRLQQGVPIVDADLNELDDIRKFELRAYLKWFVGDGVPDGNDGFHIVGTGVDNDFTITAGVPTAATGTPPVEQGLRNLGRIIVDGLDVGIKADIAFTAQDLHEDRPGAAALAARLGVPVVAKLGKDAPSGDVAVYLDVWETMVTADDDTALLHTGLGVETCARVRRDWVVRVRKGTAAPRLGDGDFLAGHSYALLAVIARRPADGQVRASDLTDRRHRRLQLPPATLVEDVLGTSIADYRAGLRRPPISLREAVNALLRGELPTSPEVAVAPAATANALDAIERAFLLDSAGGLVALFSSDRSGTDQVYAARMSLDAISGGFGAPVQVTSGLRHTRPSVAELPDASLFLVYQSQSGVNADIVAKRGPLSGLAAAPEMPVAATASVPEDSPFVVAAGPLVTVFFHKTITGATTTDRWYFRRWNLTTTAWVDNSPVELAPSDTTFRDFHAALDGTGKIWTVIKTTDGLFAIQVDPGVGVVTPGVGVVTAPFKLADQSGGASGPPFVLCPGSGGAWVFWQAAGGISARRFQGGAWQDVVASVSGTVANDRTPCAVEDADGIIWLLWSRGAVGQGDLFVMRRDALGQWATPRQLVVSGKDDTSPFAVAGLDTTVWVFWASDRDGSVKIYNKRFVTAV